MENLVFRTTGQIINMNHQLVNAVIIKDSHFQNISSGSFQMSAFSSGSSSNLKNKAIVKNITVKEIENPQRSFIVLSSNSILNLKSSTIFGVSSTNDISGVISAAINSEIDIYDTEFINNSAVTASLFKIESESGLS